MNANDQGARRDRYHAIPRTLIFLRSSNPDSGAEEILLLKGAPNKRLWANKYNGLGGHVEADEDVYAAALREVAEEAGLSVTELTLRGVVNINTGSDENGPRPGVLMFVFVGDTAERQLQVTAEGAAEWIPINEIRNYPLVDDLFEVVPRALADGKPFFGYYWPDATGKMCYRFD